MYVVETDTRIYGPFKTPAHAVKWADRELPLARWAVRPLEKP